MLARGASGGASQMPSGAGELGAQLFFAKDRDAQLASLGEFAAGIVARYHERRLLADRTSDFSTGFLDQLLRFLAAHARQGSGEHECHAVERAALGARGFVGELQIGGAQAVDQLAVAGYLEELMDGFGDLGSDFLGHLKLGDGGGRDGVQIAEGFGEEDRCSLADKADAEGGEHARQRKAARAVDVADHVAGALDAHAVEIHDVARSEVQNRFLQARGTIRVDTAASSRASPISTTSRSKTSWIS